MSLVNPQTAKAFVDSVDLSGLPGSRRFAAEASKPFIPHEDKNQAVVLGSAVISFARGISAETRQVVADSTLFAQLTANKQVPDENEIGKWYEKYFEVLTSVGWTLANRSFVNYQASSDDVDVTQAVLSIAAGLLGGAGATAFQLVKAALEALTKGAEDQPWITLFKRESQRSQAGRFQVAVIHPDADSGFVVSSMAFSLRATSTLTHVLFVKVRRDVAEFRQASGDVTINEKVVASVSPIIGQKLITYAQSYVKQLPDL
jgi:hypothetical protein